MRVFNWTSRLLPISMSVHEIQCGSLVHFCMVNSGYKKSGHHSKLVLRLAHTVSFYYSVLLVALQECGFLDSLFVAGSGGLMHLCSDTLVTLLILAVLFCTSTFTDLYHPYRTWPFCTSSMIVHSTFSLFGVQVQVYLSSKIVRLKEKNAPIRLTKET